MSITYLYAIISLMRNLNLLDLYRRKHPVLYAIAGMGDEGNGYFVVPGLGSELRIIASNDEGWDHISVSTRGRCPNWPEMKKVKELFFEDEEPAFQIFPAKEFYINCHPNCLHWWRPQQGEILMPPTDMIAPL